MIAYKGFNELLQATMGKGIFQFEAGKTYEEDKCKCASNGFHCAEDPLCALGYYNGEKDRYFIVNAEGDINQDGSGTRISCTKITLTKEITKIELAVLACRYIEKYPKRINEGRYVSKNRGECQKRDGFIIVRGKNPEAAGEKGTYLFLIQEEKKSENIETIYPVYVDGEEILENRYYRLRGGKLW